MKIKILIAFFLCIASASLLCAQETASGLELLTVNDQVTTVIIAQTIHHVKQSPESFQFLFSCMHSFHSADKGTKNF